MLFKCWIKIRIDNCQKYKLLAYWVTLRGGSSDQVIEAKKDLLNCHKYYDKEECQRML